MHDDSAALKVLREVFGFERFRGPQQAIIEHVMAGGDALVLMPTVTVLGKTAASSAHEATVYSLALSVLNLASVGSESVAAAAMRQLHVTKGDVNNVRVFVGVVAVITLLTSPAAFLFPKSGAPAAPSEEEHELLERRSEHSERQSERQSEHSGRASHHETFTLDAALSSSSDGSTSAAEADTDTEPFVESDSEPRPLPAV